MDELKVYLQTLIPFTVNEMEVFTSLFFEVQFKKNEYFAKEGEFSSKLAFISAGVMRAFFRYKSGDENQHKPDCTHKTYCCLASCLAG